MISFCKNVFYVKGYLNACLYDLNYRRLYQIQKREITFINKILTRSLSDIDLSLEEKEAVCRLQQLGIIEDSSNINMGHPCQLYTPSIKHAWIEVTKQCNHQCIHCYDESSPYIHTPMTMGDFRHAIDEVQKADIRSIQLIGGEPLCVGDMLKSMIDYSFGKFQSIELFTNGTLINSDWINFFKKYSVKLAISIHSYIPEMHDYVTQVHGSFARAKDNIRRIKESNIQYRVANVLMNGVEIGDCDTDLFILDKNRDVVRMSGRGSNIMLLNKDLLRKRMISKKSFESALRPEFVRLAFSFNRCFCSKIYIDTTLNVFPCVMERRVAHGNIKNDTLESILRQDLFVLNKDKVKVCSSCEFRYACRDCRPDSFSEDIYAKPWYCTYNPITGQWEDEEDFFARILSKKQNRPIT